jgi:alkylation response protein AidB-like acyl-CoA dehydrogenase
VYFGFTDDQLAVRDAVAGLLDRGCDLAALQAVWTAGQSGLLAGLWSDLAGMGVQGLLAPEDLGGSGFDWVTLALVLAETGRVALPLPVVETAAVAVPLLVAAGDPDGLLAGVIAGSAVVTASSLSGGAPAAATVDLFLICDENAATLYRKDQVALEATQSVDRTRDLARVLPTGEGIRLAGPALDFAALGAAAQLVGLGRELVRMTVDYVKDRKQFGVPIGSFQAVKHHLADATLQVSFAEPTVWAAAHALDRNDPDASRSVSLAKAMASDAATLAGRAALQCHGAMGYTDDYHLHLWLKRVWCLAAAHGSAHWHRDRIVRELALA